MPPLRRAGMRALGRHQRQDDDVVAAALSADADAQPGEAAADHQHVGVDDVHSALLRVGTAGAALGSCRCAGT